MTPVDELGTHAGEGRPTYFVPQNMISDDIQPAHAVQHKIKIELTELSPDISDDVKAVNSTYISPQPNVIKVQPSEDQPDILEEFHATYVVSQPTISEEPPPTCIVPWPDITEDFLSRC